MNEEKPNRLIQKLLEPLDSPNLKYVVFNSAQDVAIIVTDTDAAYIQIKTKKKAAEQIDLDDQEGIRWIRTVHIEGDKCYIVANKRNDKIGIYLAELNMSDPKAKAKYILNWPSKLDIGDCELAVMNENGDKDGPKDNIILSYKMMGFNTFNIVAIDLRHDNMIKYWHESFALWESPVRGFLLANNDFLIIS